MINNKYFNKIQNSNCKLHNEKCKMHSEKWKMHNEKCKMNNEKCKNVCILHTVKPPRINFSLKDNCLTVWQ